MSSRLSVWTRDAKPHFYLFIGLTAIDITAKGRIAPVYLMDAIAENRAADFGISK
jgi:hypothetical protein